MTKTLFALPLAALVAGCGAVPSAGTQVQAEASPQGNPVANAVHNDISLLVCPSDIAAMGTIPAVDIDATSPASLPSWPPGHNGVLAYYLEYADTTRSVNNLNTSRVEVFGVDTTNWANPTIAFHVFANYGEVYMPHNEPGPTLWTTPGTDDESCHGRMLNGKLDVSQVSAGPLPGNPPQDGPTGYPDPDAPPTCWLKIPTIIQQAKSSAQGGFCCPRTCDGYYAGMCGTYDDGCGGTLSCGCKTGFYCDDGGTCAKLVHLPGGGDGSCHGITCM